MGEAGSGGSGLVVVEGAAGIGKSRLIAELRDRARGAGLRVIAATGSELERELPFGVVRQLFEPLVAEPGRRERLLADAAAPARAVFDQPGHGSDAGEDGSFAVLHGLYWLTVNLGGERPLLLSLDDLHWCDRPSLRFAAYLARRLDGVGALLAVAVRTSEADADPLTIGELTEVPAALRLRPRPLSEAAVAASIRSRLGAEPEPAFTAACVEATGGNPLLLRQLLSSLEADGVAPEDRQRQAVREVGPRAVSRTVLLRLHRLPEEAIAVAQAVAVLGEGARLPLVAPLAALDEQAVARAAAALARAAAALARAAAALARADILRPEPPLGFVHPLVAAAVYRKLDIRSRRELSRVLSG